MALEWDFWAKLFFFLGFVWWAIKWTARNLRAQIGPTRSGTQDFAPGLSADAVQAIVGRGLATRVQLISMSAKEQRLLSKAALSLQTRVAAAGARIGDSPTAVTRGARPPRTHCPRCGMLVENWPERIPWRVECVGCGSELVLRREGERVILNYVVARQ